MNDDSYLASRRLRTCLSDIAKKLKETESARGKWVKKERVDGYDLEFKPDPPDELGLNTITFINVEVALWRELGSVLERVAKGEDARRLFGQHLRTNPAKDGEHRLRALAYWSVRSRAPEADDEEALDLARNIVPTSKELKRDTLRKYAQRHRMRCLCLLSLHPNWAFRFETSDIEIRALGPGIAPLIEYLRKKEAKANWLKPPPFQKVTDLLIIRSNGSEEGPPIDEPAFPGMSMFAEELPPTSSLHIEQRQALLEQVQVRHGNEGDQE